MKRVREIICVLAVLPSIAHTAKLLSASDSTCLKASETALATSSEESSFYVDQNGQCGNLSKQDIVSPEKCSSLQKQCNKNSKQYFSNLYQLQNQKGLMAILYKGCGCYDTTEDIKTKNLQASGTPTGLIKSSQTIACSTTQLANAINAANLTTNTTLTLASNCTYLIDTPATPNEGFSPITSSLTLIGGENTVIARNTSMAMFRVFTVNNLAQLTLKNLTIKDGSTTGLGGAILNSGTLSLEKVSFLNNNASNGGALAITFGGTASIIKSEFISNTTTSVGGGAFINFANAQVSATRFRENYSPINGGAVNTQPGATTTISSSDFSRNTSGSLGGTLSNLGTLTMDHSQIQSNSGSSGGAIATGNADVTLTVMKIINNSPDNCSPLNTIDGCQN